MDGLLAVALGGALSVGAGSAAVAAPNKGGGTTTTTTTKSGKSGSQSGATAKLVIKGTSVGHVSVEAAETTTFQPGTDGESLHVGDTVQTDSVGRAEIDYAPDTYTRLDVNTTFTIKGLTDNQGHRQVQGDLTSGQTWNRTVALTQSESFQQTGGGATAAVSGTAFAVSCTSPTQCTFTGVVDNVTLTGANGQTEMLNPLSQCVSSNGSLCAAPSKLTPDQLALIQWITDNVFLDLLEHGIGDGIFAPFSGNVIVSGAVLQSFTPSTPNQGFTPFIPPPNNNPPNNNPLTPTGPIIDSGHPISVASPVGVTSASCVGTTVCSAETFTPATDITLGDDQQVDFKLNVIPDSTGSFYIQFLTLPTDGFTSASQALGVIYIASGSVDRAGQVNETSRYNPADVFQFVTNDATGADHGSTSFSYKAVDTNDPALANSSNPIPINVNLDCAPSDGGVCPSSASTTTAPMVTASSTSTPTATEGTTTPPANNPTTAPPTSSTTFNPTPATTTTPPAGS